MQLIGLTGGIASGKSTAAEYLRRHGIPVIDADQLARQALASGSAGYRRACQAFPEAIDPQTGLLDRLRLGEVVFKDRQRRRALESIVHPIVIRGIIRSLVWHWLAGHARVVLDIPLLFELRLDRWMSRVIVIAADEATQTLRLAARNALTKEQARARMGAQMPMEEKCRRATVVIHNDGDVEQLHARLHCLVVNQRPSVLVHRVLLHALPLISVVSILVHHVLPHALPPTSAVGVLVHRMLPHALPLISAVGAAIYLTARLFS